ncbi:isochorismatase hydrolase [Stemphylium lycopersici]|uniref:Isochorismatase hydrolase n=1 Tax=Stemphylium lycopersici TaxID=183478 RepID=A0A364N163_STELY|nr:isochorismatase hydrolase [Stemphylium lycopersici]RAR03137.1 isochorismatase hydrolase [Stemphylium lycopersici]RAR09134.1 isochorismatase hydrolase [Stemphylium lycopersici]
MSPTTPKTAIVLVDVYNEFLHPSGKIYPAIAESIQTTDSVTHIQTLISTARAAHLPIYYALHQTYKPGNYDGWQHMNATTNSIKAGKVIEDGSWGAELYEGMEPDVLGNGDVVVNYQLHQREITHLVLGGMVANTCLESTARYARELGYHVTLLTDATAGFSNAHKDAATDLIWPLIADEVKTVGEWAASLPANKDGAGGEERL